MMAPGGQDAHRFLVLDSWRGLAALAVVWHHIQGTASPLSGPFHESLVSAVDFFFVLSGFVISASYGARLAAGFSPLRFLVLRVGRVWPLHATMVMTYLALETGLGLAGGVGSTAGGGRAPFTGPRDLAALPASLLLLQAWIWPGRDLWNTQSWSVSIELGLYLAAVALWRLCRSRAELVGLALGVGALVALQAELPVSPLMMRGIAGFGFGMGCWHLWPCVRGWRLAPPAAALAEAAMVAAVLAALALQAEYIVLYPLFALIVLVFAQAQGPVSRLLSTAPFQWLGVLSYALYMVHGLVIGRAFDVLALFQRMVGAEWVAARLAGQDMLLLPDGPALAVATAMIAASLAVAWFAWRFIEWPARGASRRLAARIGEAGAASA